MGGGGGGGVSKIHRDYGIAEKLSRGDGFEEPYWESIVYTK